MPDHMTNNAGDAIRSIIDEFDAEIEQDMQDIINNSYDSIDVERVDDELFAEEAVSIEQDIITDTEEENTEGEDDTEDDSADDVADDPYEDHDYKNWLFEENVRLKEVERHLEEEKERLEAYEKELDKKAKDVESMSDKFSQEKAQFKDEMNILTGQVTRERARLKQDEQFFDQKMAILKAGFADLDKAKRELEAEKRRFDAKPTAFFEDDIPGYAMPVARALFAGISNPLMLKKRYKDLVKIYHPDNLAGDQGLFKAITLEYERLQGTIGNEDIG